MGLSREALWDQICLPGQKENEKTARLMRDLPSSFGGTLTALMDRQGYTQAELAEKIRCSEKTVQRMRNDEKYVPSLKIVIKTCASLQLPLVLCLDVVIKSEAPQKKTVSTVELINLLAAICSLGVPLDELNDFLAYRGMNMLGGLE